MTKNCHFRRELYSLGSLSRNSIFVHSQAMKQQLPHLPWRPITTHSTREPSRYRGIPELRSSKEANCWNLLAKSTHIVCHGIVSICIARHDGSSKRPSNPLRVEYWMVNNKVNKTTHIVNGTENPWVYQHPDGPSVPPN